MTVNWGFWLPAFDELADPRVIARLAAEAEEHGWHGFFLWDHVAWDAPVVRVADPWICLAAAATATRTLRLGPMATPVARRRPAKLARETAALDLLSGGRVTFGAGLGSDAYGGEFARFGEQTDARVRAEMLDEALDVLAAAWSGRPVRHRGRHYAVDGVAFAPTPVQERVPVWIAGRAGLPRPLRRAARFDGYFPTGLEDPAQLAEIREELAGLRAEAGTPYDIAVPVRPGADPSGYVAAGATWCLTEFEPDELTLDRVRGVLRDGPAIPVATTDAEEATR